MPWPHIDLRMEQQVLGHNAGSVKAFGCFAMKWKGYLWFIFIIHMKIAKAFIQQIIACGFLGKNIYTELICDLFAASI